MKNRNCNDELNPKPKSSFSKNPDFSSDFFKGYRKETKRKIENIYPYPSRPEGDDIIEGQDWTKVDPAIERPERH